MNIFIEDVDHERKPEDVINEHPDMTEIEEVDGGWMLFPTVTDWKTWADQE